MRQRDCGDCTRNVRPIPPIFRAGKTLYVTLVAPPWGILEGVKEMIRRHLLRWGLVAFAVPALFVRACWQR